MFDTFAISKTLYRAPDEIVLLTKGWTRCLFDSQGKCFKYTLNDKDKLKPRLTLTLRLDGYWTLRAEVSLGSWCFNSNIHLVDEVELEEGLDQLSKYVEENSEVIFEAHLERVTRVDFTQDFQVGEPLIIPIIENLSKMTLPKYNRIKMNDTTIYFRNAGKKKTKEFKIYGKYAEMGKKNKDISEQEKGKGILRLEVSFLNKAVNRLADSLNLPSNDAPYILTKDTSEKVMRDAKEKLSFEKILRCKTSDTLSLFERLNYKTASDLIVYLALRKQYGEGLWQNPIFRLSKRTCQRRWKLCKETGVITLE